MKKNYNITSIEEIQPDSKNMQKNLSFESLQFTLRQGAQTTDFITNIP